MATAEDIVRGFLIVDIAVVMLVMLVLIWRYLRAIARLKRPLTKNPGMQLEPEDEIALREARTKLRFTFILGFICLGSSLFVLRAL